MSASILRVEEPKLSVDVDACLLPCLAALDAFGWKSKGSPTEGGM